ncbi:MAG: MFS transporter [Bacillus sp. (in: firmicutes)]
MKSKNFRLLWIGQTIANLGDVLYIVALISLLYTATKYTLYLAMLPFLNTIGRFISGAFSPLLFNRYELKDLLVYSQALKTLFLLFLVCFLSILTASNINCIFVFIFLLAIFDGWAMPATNAILPRVVQKNELLKANSFVSVLYESTQLGGWAIGGMLVSLLNGQSLIWFTIVLYGISTAMMIGIVDHTPFQPITMKRNVKEELKEGWMIIWKNPMFRNIHIVYIIESIANVIWTAAILYVFVKEILHVTEAWWGYMNTVFFIGLLIGGFLCIKLASFIEKNLRKAANYASFAVSIITILFALNSIPWIALLLIMLHGIKEQIKSISLNTYLQKEASSDVLVKIYGAQNTMVSLVFGISALLAGFFAEISIRFTFFAAGFLLLLSSYYLLTKKSNFPSYYKEKGEEE